jgi:hypothetical protein
LFSHRGLNGLPQLIDDLPAGLKGLRMATEQKN